MLVCARAGEKKQGRGCVRVPVHNLGSPRLLLADLGVIGEVQVVRSGTIEIDPTLDHIAVT